MLCSALLCWGKKGAGVSAPPPAEPEIRTLHQLRGCPPRRPHYSLRPAARACSLAHMAHSMRPIAPPGDAPECPDDGPGLPASFLLLLRAGPGEGRRLLRVPPARKLCLSQKAGRGGALSSANHGTEARERGRGDWHPPRNRVGGREKSCITLLGGGERPSSQPAVLLCHISIYINGEGVSCSFSHCPHPGLFVCKLRIMPPSLRSSKGQGERWQTVRPRTAGQK